MSDRRLWLEEPCPTCGTRGGVRCQTSRYSGKPSRLVHAARGWRQRSCPTCKVQAGELCKTPTGRRAGQPHTARLQRGRRELFAEEQVWEELGRWEAAVALVRFSGGGGNQGSIAAVTLEDAAKCELARWGSGEGELPEALAAPIWGRYALFRGHPRISGLLMWDVQERQVVVAGERGGQKFEELLSASRQLYRPTVTPVAVTAGDTSRPIRYAAAPRHLASLRCPRRRAPVRALRRPTSGRAARGGALLLQAVPSGRLARASEAALPAGRPCRPRRARGAAGRCPLACEWRHGSAPSGAGRRPPGTPSGSAAAPRRPRPA